MSARPTLIIRADASARIGGGHVQRCHVIAERLKQRDWRVRFATRPETLEIFADIAADPDTIVLLDDNEAAAIGAAARGSEPVLVLVDHYGRDDVFERDCRDWADSIIVLDDIPGRRHDSEILIDPTLGRESGDYAGKVGQVCRILAGPAFAPLRHAFADRRGLAQGKRGETREVERALIALGATDPDNVTGAAITAYARSGLAARLDVVLSRGAPHLNAVRQSLAALRGRGHLHLSLDGEQMAQLMLDCDLAVGAAGGGSWERCCLGLPSIVLVIADNQRQVARGLSRAGAALVLDLRDASGEAKLAEAISGLAADADGRRNMAARALGICDGLGAGRIADEIERLAA